MDITELNAAELDLLDEFAGKVIQGICASQPGAEITNRFLARESYSIALAMMEERKTYRDQWREANNNAAKSTTSDND